MSRKSLADYADGPLAPYLHAPDVFEPDGDALAGGQYATVLSAYRLQDMPNYRAALQAWFELVEPGGHLVVTAPHAFLSERQTALPSRWRPGQKRLYTPASLMLEVEEALAPNSYRVRYLGDDDAGYDYALPPSSPPVGQCDVAVVVQKIAPPPWPLANTAGERLDPVRPAPENLFEPARTRVEQDRTLKPRRILLLKLDHMGDFIMGTPALEKARRAFPDAEITLAVGSWNEAAARALGLFEHVAVFDAFPRNSTEERADVRGAVSEFRKRFAADYDVAVDLRSDPDTRVLLEATRAQVKAALGTKTSFPFLDIFLPIDHTRAGVERAWELELATHTFSEHACWRNHFEIQSAARPPQDETFALVWGPYKALDPGRYRFEPFSEVKLSDPGILRADVALNAATVAERFISGEHAPALDFVNTEPGAQLEYRIYNVAGEPSPAFRFYGGRLIKQGSSGVLHQSEYLSLLVELVAMRVNRFGLLQDVRAGA